MDRDKLEDILGFYWNQRNSTHPAVSSPLGHTLDAIILLHGESLIAELSKIAYPSYPGPNTKGAMAYARDRIKELREEE